MGLYKEHTYSQIKCELQAILNGYLWSSLDPMTVEKAKSLADVCSSNHSS